MTSRLAIKQPFDPAHSLDMGQAFRWRRLGYDNLRRRDWGNPPAFWLQDGGGWYSGVLEGCLVHVRQVDDGLEYRTGGRDGERDDIDLGRALHHYFRLDDDIGEVYNHQGPHPAVANAIARYLGLRVLRQERWECLVSYLCSGTNGIRGITSCVERIARLSGRTVRLDGEERYLFPTPRQPNAAGRESLDDLGLGLDRARNIFLMGIQICYDQTMLDRAAGPGVPGCEIVRLLDSYRGIGPKIASCVALMSLDKLDAFPVDRWVQRALSCCDLSTMPVGFAGRVTGPRPLTDAQQYRVAEWARGHFGECAGYANQ